MPRRFLSWSLLITSNALIWGVLSFYDATQAAPQPGKQPFGNAVEQRGTMIRHLDEIKTLLEEQNRLLRMQAAQKSDEARGQRSR